jgi:hypothetical protein
MVSNINFDIMQLTVSECKKCIEMQRKQNNGKYNCQYVLTEELCPKIERVLNK